MCELFGVSSPEKIEINELLRTFFSHGNKHPDGWGMAFLKGNNVSIEKQPTASVKSRYLKERMRSPIRVTNFLAHIRYATRGDMVYENCHPFSETDAEGRNWTMIHNGTIFDFPKLSQYCSRQEGTTDSERILLYIVDQVSEVENKAGRELTDEERFYLLDKVVCEMSDENKLNLILYDGSLMYVHTNQKGTLYSSQRGGATVFSTTELDHLTDDCWKPVPMTRLLGYKNGRLVYTGTNHGHEFVDSEEKYRLLFLDYSSL